jgi:hypothetical protein
MILNFVYSISKFQIPFVYIITFIKTFYLINYLNIKDTLAKIFYVT